MRSAKTSASREDLNMNGMMPKITPFPVRRDGKTPLNIPSNTLVVKA